MAGKIVITGGSGFIGTNAVEHFGSRGWAVRNLDIRPPRNPSAQAAWERVDILDGARLASAVGEFSPDVVLHLAARTDLEGRSLGDYLANTQGVANVVESCRVVRSIRRLISASSMLVCKLGYLPIHDNDCCPTTAYGESKVVGEQIVRNSHEVPFAWTIARITSIWGPWFEVPYRNFFDAIEKGNYFHPKSTRIHRSFGFVGNTVYELEKLVTASVETIDRRTVYLADYPATEVLYWARIISREMNAPNVREAPLILLRLAAIVGDACKKLGIAKNPPLTTFRLKNLLTDAVYDLSSIKALCGDLPYGLEDGVHQTVKWLRARHVNALAGASTVLQ